MITPNSRHRTQYFSNTNDLVRRGRTKPAHVLRALETARDHLELRAPDISVIVWSNVVLQ